MAAGLAHPERVVGFHFFNPVAVLPLVEVVRGARTDDATLATAFAVGSALKKSCVLVKDAPAFVFNRLVTRALGEVVAAVDEGTPVRGRGRGAAPAGHADVAADAARPGRPGGGAAHRARRCTRHSRTGSASSPGFQALVAAGKDARLTWDGRHGRWSTPRWRRCGRVVPALLTERRCWTGPAPRWPRRSGCCSTRGWCAAPQDIDLCLLLGGGWAFWNGGVTPYLDRTGVSERVTGRRFLPPGVASVR